MKVRAKMTYWVSGIALLSGLAAEVMQGHLDEHVVHAATEAEREQGAAEMMDVIRAYLK